MTAINLDFAAVENAVKDLVDVVGYGLDEEPVVAAAFKNDAHDHRGRFAPKGKGVPIKDPDEAIDALVDGKKIELAAEDVGPLFDKLAAREKDDPLVNLANATITGTELFGVNDKGIAREDMPQLVGNITTLPPSSKAAQLTPDEKGYVSIESQFRDHLTAQGATIVDSDMPVSEMRPTQSELDGRKSAQIAARIEAGTFPDDQRIFLSEDGYIVDGHHRWAANVGIDARDGKFDDVTMPVATIDMPIMDVLEQALSFAEEWGIPQRKHGESVLTVYAAIRRADLYAAFKNDAHDHKGRFAPKGTGVKVAKVLDGLADPMQHTVRAWEAAHPGQKPTEDDLIEISNGYADVIQANKAAVRQLGDVGESVLAGVGGWTGASADRDTLREQLAADDPALAGFEDALRTAPVNKEPLYRGMKWWSEDGDPTAMIEAVSSLKAGDVLPTQGLASFSESEGHARRFGVTYEVDDGVLITIKPGKGQALDVGAISNTPAEHEHLVGRDLRVVSAKVTRRQIPPDEDEYPEGYETVWVEIEAETV